jgi:hypothetical protein
MCSADYFISSSSFPKCEILMARGKKRNSPLKFIDERQLKIKPAAGLDLENERLVVKKRQI